MMIHQEIDLVEVNHISNEVAYDGIGQILYHIYIKNTPIMVGRLELRLTMNEEMYFYGHVGYYIEEMFRGNHFAYKACMKLRDIAKNKLHFEKLFFTCCPDNIPSLKTIERLKARFIEEIEVPKHHELYYRGEKKKYVYLWEL